MRVIHISDSDVYGGAARAAFRIHKALTRHTPTHGIESAMKVARKGSTCPTVQDGVSTFSSPLWKRFRPRLRKLRNHLLALHSDEFNTTAWPSTLLAKELKEIPGDPPLIHLHWLGNDTMSIEEISHLANPLVWTLHDQWPIMGCHHYKNDNIQRKKAAERIERDTIERKTKSWRGKHFQLVSPSQWMNKCVESNTIFSNYTTHIIPNPIDIGFWSPWDKWQARDLLALPADKKLILFGAENGVADPRKGSDLLFSAMTHLRDYQGMDECRLVAFGAGEILPRHIEGIPVDWIGSVTSDLVLRLLYVACDVFVLPSRQDNLPNTGIESMACGTPVVGFNIGGIPDIIDDHKNGRLAVPFDPRSLADSIAWVLDRPSRLVMLGKDARQKAVSEWSEHKVASLYSSVYRQARETAASLRFA